MEYQSIITISPGRRLLISHLTRPGYLDDSVLFSSILWSVARGSFHLCDDIGGILFDENSDIPKLATGTDLRTSRSLFSYRTRDGCICMQRDSFIMREGMRPREDPDCIRAGH